MLKDHVKLSIEKEMNLSSVLQPQEEVSPESKSYAIPPGLMRIKLSCFLL